MALNFFFFYSASTPLTLVLWDTRLLILWYFYLKVILQLTQRKVRDVLSLATGPWLNAVNSDLHSGWLDSESPHFFTSSQKEKEFSTAKWDPPSTRSTFIFLVIQQPWFPAHTLTLGISPQTPLTLCIWGISSHLSMRPILQHQEIYLAPWEWTCREMQ